MTEELMARITDYLALGGLVNPEMANHDAVRDLLIDCRAAYQTVQGENAELVDAGKLAAAHVIHLIDENRALTAELSTLRERVVNECTAAVAEHTYQDDYGKWYVDWHAALSALSLVSAPSRLDASRPQETGESRG